MSAFCTKCGEPLKPGVQFCTACGAPVAQKPKPEQRVCPSCGKPLKPNTKFCTACGANLAQLDSAEVRPQSIAAEGVSAAAFTAGNVTREAEDFGELTNGAAPATPARPNPNGKPASGQQEAAQSRPGIRPAGVAPQRTTVCPRCGNAIQPGRTVCGVCGTAVAGTRPPLDVDSDEEYENEIRESKNRTGLWITLAAVGLVIIAIAAVILIFWDKLF